MRTIAIVAFGVLLVIMVGLIAAGAHQFVSVVVPLIVFPVLIGIGGLRKMVRNRNR